MSQSAESVVIVGAGLAGLRTAETLRSEGFDGAITLAGAEPHAPYDRPPLSKQVLAGTMAAEDVTLRGDKALGELGVSLRLGSAAVRLERAERIVTFDGGGTVGYDQLVIATGIAPIRLPIAEGLAGVHVLRTIDDVLGLRAELAQARSALIVGAGFIGCEAAVALRGAGLDVVMVEGQSTPLAGALGAEVGALVARMHTEEGVDLRCDVTVAELLGSGRVTGARLSDGSEVPAQLVLSGIGSRPATGWLEDSGLALDNGVCCDERGRTEDRRVWAVGDVASWRNPTSGGRVRVEHWAGAGEQAAIVARAIARTEQSAQSSRRDVPYFWSDQYGMKIQAFGHVDATDEVRLVHSDGRKFLALYGRDGVLTAAVGCGAARKLAKLRPLLQRGGDLEEAAAIVEGAAAS